jgi:hypothetical protein
MKLLTHAALHAALLLSIVTAPAFAQEAATIAPQAAASTPSYAKIPSNATSSGDLTASSRWIWSHDKGTPGSSVGSSHFPESSPSLDGKSREFAMSYSGKGGERFSVTFAHNAAVTHFVYDTWVWIDKPSQLANLELDMNQVIPNGKTVIYAFQCSGYAGQWEYTIMKNNAPHWQRSGLPCAPKNLSAKAWHHVQIASHRDGSGNVTFEWVSLDGTYKQLKNATGPGALSLHWTAGDLNLNFQLDGANSSGSVKVYSDKLNIFYW